MKLCSMTILIKAIEQYFPAMLFPTIELYNVHLVLTFKSADKLTIEP